MHLHDKGDNKGRESRLIFSIVLNFLITVSELAGGLLSSSLSLMSDALHNLNDTSALFISLIAARISGKPKSEESTFGYKRAEVLAAFINASLLIIVSLWIFKEAFIRFFHPGTINSRLMLIIAGIGFIANLLCVVLLKNDAGHNINMRAAYAHLFMDTISSVAVIAGGLSIMFWGLWWIDPVLSVIIALYVFKGGFAILSDAVHILMQHTPKHIDVRIIKADIEKIKGVKNIHHLHVWSIAEDEIYIEAHIEISEDMKISQTCVLKSEMEKLLLANYKINHSTFQFEHGVCADVSLISKY
jgi:cobalt-zinc-cadmium efflux system protein